MALRDEKGKSGVKFQNFEIKLNVTRGKGREVKSNYLMDIIYEYSLQGSLTYYVSQNSDFLDPLVKNCKPPSSQKANVISEQSWRILVENIK